MKGEKTPFYVGSAMLLRSPYCSNFPPENTNTTGFKVVLDQADSQQVSELAIYCAYRNWRRHYCNRILTECEVRCW